MTEARPAAIDEERVRRFALSVWQLKQGEVIALMIHLGDRLGLYRAMAGQGPLHAGQLAARTGLVERWVLEWLRSQAAAGLIDSADGDSFELTAEGAAVLADEDGSVWFAAGAFQGGVAAPEVVDRLAAAFRTGIGLSYDELGEGAAHGVERMLGPWARLALVPVILPALPGIVDRLEAGADVLDVGCGAGVALAAMAESFPNSRFAGVDSSQHAITRAQLKAGELANLTVRLGAAVDLPDRPSYDLILTLDCLHDMPDPVRAAAAVRRAIRDDGVWLIKEIRAHGRWQENLRNPLLAMLYGTSVATCMSSALSVPGGAGLGTLGLPAERVERLARDAGFGSIAVHDIDDPANLYYEVRP